MKRTIVHLDLDSFFVSVERLLNPGLNGKPVVVGSLSKRGVVASCSYEARKYGIHSAMPSLQAQKLCPNAIFIPGNRESYTEYSEKVTQIIAESSPIFEKASIDEFYIDISGMDRLHGNLKWTSELRERIIKETGLPLSCGISVNKTLAKMATNEAKPNGIFSISESEVQKFLDPLSVKKIPMIGTKSFEKLRAHNIRTIAELRNISLEDLIKIFGKNGKKIALKARGIDDRPVIPYREPKSVSKERTFVDDIANENQLRIILLDLTEKTGYALRKKGYMAGSLSIKIRYNSFETRELQKSFPFTNYDHVLIHIAEELFKKLYRKEKPVRLIGVRLGNLVAQWDQLDLFKVKKNYDSLYQTMDEIKNKYGKNSIIRAVNLTGKSK